MRLAWSATPLQRTPCNLGPLAVIAPLLEQMDVAALIDRHLPPDPQLEFSHGQVLRLLLAARLCQPLALVNVAAWAEETGAEFLWGLPADKLNDDRLGRALDAFFTQRHAILAGVAAHVVRTFGLPTQRLHYDTTHLLFYGAYDASRPAPDGCPLPPATPSADYPPAHLTHGYPLKDHKLVHAGLCCAVDDLGAVPLFGHVVAGNTNGKTAIAQQFQLLQDYLPLPELLLVSDRGTYAPAHVARLERAGHHALCSVPWGEVRPLFHAHRDRLLWNPASFLSVEQRRRRQVGSALPREHYELAVLRHQVEDPDGGSPVPCRLIFVFSSADQKVCRQQRARRLAKVQAGLEQIARSVARGTCHSDPASVQRRAAQLLAVGAVSRFFRWELLPLTAAERAALPPPGRGCRRATHRFVSHYDAAAAEAAAADDGYAALLTTAPLTRSADTLFAEFKQQCYVEQAHHQWKGPLAVRPVFLKSPRRVEALVGLLQLALTAYHLLQRRYRQAVADDAAASERRMTAEGLLRAFRVCPLVKEQAPLGCVVRALQLTPRQQAILQRLQYPSPAQMLSHRLPPYPRK